MPTPFDLVDHSVNIPDLSQATWQTLDADMGGFDLQDYEVCDLGFIKKKGTNEPIHHLKNDNGYVYVMMKPQGHRDHRIFTVCGKRYQLNT